MTASARTSRWSTRPGGCAIVHSDDAYGIQRLNQEAAKALADGRKAGIDISKAEAWTWLSRNPAKALGILDKTGTLEPGKGADVVIWSGDPFSVYTRADLVFVDGAVTWDRAHTRQPAGHGLRTRPARRRRPQMIRSLLLAAALLARARSACAQTCRHHRRQGRDQHAARHHRERHGRHQQWPHRLGRHGAAARRRERHRRQGQMGHARPVRGLLPRRPFRNRLRRLRRRCRRRRRASSRLRCTRPTAFNPGRYRHRRHPHRGRHARRDRRRAGRWPVRRLWRAGRHHRRLQQPPHREAFMFARAWRSRRVGGRRLARGRMDVAAHRHRRRQEPIRAASRTTAKATCSPARKLARSSRWSKAACR